MDRDRVRADAWNANRAQNFDRPRPFTRSYEIYRMDTDSSRDLVFAGRLNAITLFVRGNCFCIKSDSRSGIRCPGNAFSTKLARSHTRTYFNTRSGSGIDDVRTFELFGRQCNVLCVTASAHGDLGFALRGLRADLVCETARDKERIWR